MFLPFPEDWGLPITSSHPLSAVCFYEDQCRRSGKWRGELPWVSLHWRCWINLNWLIWCIGWVNSSILFDLEKMHVTKLSGDGDILQGGVNSYAGLIDIELWEQHLYTKWDDTIPFPKALFSKGVCQTLKRVGGRWWPHWKAVDGDKFVCFDSFNPTNCLVYSFGIRFNFKPPKNVQNLGFELLATTGALKIIWGIWIAQ